MNSIIIDDLNLLNNSPAIFPNEFIYQEFKMLFEDYTCVVNIERNEKKNHFQ